MAQLKGGSTAGGALIYTSANLVIPEIAPATSITTGVLKLFSDTVQTVAASSVSTTASRTYGIQVNSSGQAVVNVPWVATAVVNDYNASADGNSNPYGLVWASGNTLYDTTSKLTFVNSTGALTAVKVYNAVYNDIADFIEVEEDTVFEYGRVIIRKDGKHSIANKKTKKNIIGLASDTYGFGVGQKAEGVPTIPIAIGGFVLAHTKIYTTGTPLETSNDGGLIKASFFTKLLHSERIIATFYKEESLEIWNDVVEVKGRHWVKVK